MRSTAGALNVSKHAILGFVLCAAGCSGQGGSDSFAQGGTFKQSSKVTDDPGDEGKGGGGEGEGGDDGDGRHKPPPESVSVQKVCFQVNNPGDPTSVAVTGSIFYKGKLDRHDSAVVLVHGTACTRDTWDGGAARAIAGSVARRFAQAGYAVITYDRVGFGESVYNRPRGGDLLTISGHVEMAHQIVTQVHAGTFTVTDDNGTCPSGVPVGHGFHSVILGGHSNGGDIAAGYSELYHDISAVIPMMFSSYFVEHSTTSKTGTLLSESVTPHSTDEYVYFFRPDPSGESQDCKQYLTYGPGVDPRVVTANCANHSLVLTPIEEFPSTIPQALSNREAISKVGPTPALLVFADNDVFFPGPGNANPPNDPDVQTPEIQNWKQNCGCDVSTYTAKNSGHDFKWHTSMPNTVDYMLGWLKSRGL